MTSPARTWMPLYPADYLADTVHLTLAEHGAYLLLIMHYWRTGGPLPADEAHLAKLVRASPAQWNKVRPALIGLFAVSDSGWSHKRIDAELVAVKVNQERQRQRTSYATEARWRRNGLRNGDADTSVTDSVTDSVTLSSSPSPSPRKKKEAPPLVPPTGGRAKGARLGKDWKPGDEDRRYCQNLDLDPERTAEDFRDYWLAKPGLGGVKLDWARTWRTWCRHEADRKASGPVGPRGAGRDRGGFGAALARVAAKMDRNAGTAQSGQAVDLDNGADARQSTDAGSGASPGGPDRGEPEAGQPSGSGGGAGRASGAYGIAGNGGARSVGGGVAGAAVDVAGGRGAARSEILAEPVEVVAGVAGDRGLDDRAPAAAAGEAGGSAADDLSVRPEFLRRAL